ncbi:MAG: hypothetical protein NDF55_03730 [archaeon GB-1867-005]|nr:hypothetical protein [Candidatus Culexmicrobium cathedralense]
MRKREIRLRYAGLVNFASNLISVFTGMMFVTMTSRRLPEAEFGLWYYIGVVVQYLVIPAAMTNYWLTRYAGRGFRVGKTGLIVNSIVMIVSLLVYSAASPYVMYPASEYEYLQFIIMLVALQIPAEYFTSTLVALASGVAPQAYGYGQLILETSKLIAGYFLVVQWRMGLPGAMLAFIAAKYAYVLFLALYLREDLKGSFNPEMAKKWIKLWWLPAYGLLPAYMNTADVMLITYLIGSVPAAHMKAVQTVIAVILYSNALTSALYPKLLSGGTGRDIEVAMSFMLMFAIPMAAGTIAMSKVFLSLLKPAYIASASALSVAAIQALLLSLTNLFAGSLAGIERIELFENVSFKDYIKSKLFYVPSIRLITRIAYLAALGLVLYITSTSVSDPITIVFMWIGVKAVFDALTMLIYAFKLSREIDFKLPLTSIMKYTASSLVMLAVLWLLGIGQVECKVFVEAFKLAIMGVAIGAAIYFTLIAILDGEVRRLFKDAINELKKMARLS